MSYKQQQRVDYTAEGLELSNERSRATHLVQAQAVEGRCTERCFVLFDDTWPMNPASGRYDGKGGAAVDWLLSRGFELVEQSSPEQASHLGFVLVRRLPVEERPEVCSGVGNSEAAHEEIQSAISAHEAGTRLSANEPDATRVFITSPAEEDEVPAGAVLLAIAVTGLRPETHSLIVFAQGVELMRVTRFEDEASECADPASLQASETRGEAGVCADGEVEVRRVGVSILMEPGVKVFSVHVQDAMTRRTDAEVSRRVTVVSASA
ncbi:hypothetical protein T484DRAFT_1938783 [Baffinella frigidus]|nr:hypothetical protein T484DRAFT_1938783 [Cryptophyta sp. CCMP2293]